MTIAGAQRKGYRIIAGPFVYSDEQDVRLCRGITHFIEVTGGRVISVETEPGVACLYRSVLELETMKQTERRLKAAKLRNN